MQTPEGAVKKRVKALLTFNNCYQYWPVSNGMGAPSLDCIGCYKGRFFGIECKAPGKKPTPRQEVTMNAMMDAAAAVFVVDGDNFSLGLLKTWLEAVKCL